MAPKRNIWWLGLALTALLVVASYAISLNAWWVGDDYNYVRPKGWDAVANFYNPVGRQFYRPLTWSSWALDWALFGAAPLGWRLTSLLMHLSNTLFAALLVRELTGKPRLAILAAALFALHPAATETVTWQGGRADVSFALAWLPALWLWVRWRKGARIGWWVGAGVLGLISFLGKEAALTLPLASIWIDVTLGRAWPLRVWEDGPRPLRDPPLLIRLLRDHSLFLLAAGLYVLMRLLLALTRQGTLGYGEGQLAFLRSFEHAVNVIAGYIFMALGLWWVPQEIVAWPLVAKLVVIGVAAMGGVLLVRWLGRVALFAIGWTAITLLLTLQAVAPRWFYVPALGVGILIAAIWDRLTAYAGRVQSPQRRRLPRALSALPLVVLVVWSLLTFVHNELWRQSGEEARRILREVEAVYPASRLPATFYVANPPYSHQGVLLFNSGFDTAMNLVYLDWEQVRAYNMTQHTDQVKAALADPSKLGINPVFIRYENGHIVPYPSLQALAEADGFVAQP
jgi:hypothetical protein